MGVLIKQVLIAPWCWSYWLVVDQMIDKAVRKEANINIKVDSKVTKDVIADLFVNKVGHFDGLHVTLHNVVIFSTFIAWSTSLKTIFIYNHINNLLLHIYFH